MCERILCVCVCARVTLAHTHTTRARVHVSQHKPLPQLQLLFSVLGTDFKDFLGSLFHRFETVLCHHLATLTKQIHQRKPQLASGRTADLKRKNDGEHFLALKTDSGQH